MYLGVCIHMCMYVSVCACSCSLWLYLCHGVYVEARGEPLAFVLGFTLFEKVSFLLLYMPGKVILE